MKAGFLYTFPNDFGVCLFLNGFRMFSSVAGSAWKAWLCEMMGQ